MLEQILKDLWVDPELLEKLSEDQKQQLFCHMREEQVRRWKIWDEQHPTLEQKNNLNRNEKKKKKVEFLLGDDGEPWVWVMGEHSDDKSIEQILEEESREKAITLAKQEAEQLRKKLEVELLIEEDKSMNNIYNTTEEVTYRKPHPPQKIIQDTPRDVLQEIKFNKKPKNGGVASRIAQWENKVMEERSSQIFETLQKKKQLLVNEAEENSVKQEELWREQERKAKEAEQQIREIARRAREEHRRSAVLMESTDTEQTNTYCNESLTSPERPPSKEAIYDWFNKSEKLRKAGIDPSTNKIAPWFHGLITRQEAETLLKDQEIGSFLVRVSEKIWGYAISLKEEGRCKHYLVDASNGHYQFPGQNQIIHKTLADLVSYHSWEPITYAGKEILKKPCAWKQHPDIFIH